MSVSRSRTSPKGCALPTHQWTSCTRGWPALGFVPAYPTNHFSLGDVGHQAEVVPHFLQEVARVLRPGGFFLSAEWGVQPTLHPEHPSFADDDVYIPKTISFYKAASYVGILSSHPPCSCTVLICRIRHRDIVPSLAPQIVRLIRQTTPFEAPVSKQWAIPISTHYTPDIPPSVAFVSRVMGRITQGYADALVAGGSFLQEDANAFKNELDQGFGIYIMYQTVFARKKSSG